jgi:predicted AlkP superfamily pyrophosphatase or phosphodiesterase
MPDCPRACLHGSLAARLMRPVLPALLLVTLALGLTACVLPQAGHRAGGQPRPIPLLLIGIDGFRPDYLQFPEARVLRDLAAGGAQAAALQPAYPSLTFPNHYTLVTGLHPDRHGIVNNSMRDPALGNFAMHLRAAVADGRWWGGEPIWITARRHGLRSATLFWPGTEANVQGQHPHDWLPYDGAMSNARRVQQVLDWLAREESTRPDFMTLYFEQVDSIGHEYGPDSLALRHAVAAVDAAIGQLLVGIEHAGWSGRIHLVIVSDHGMTRIDEERPILLDELLDPRSFELISYGASAGIEPRRGRRAEVEAALLREHAHMRCLRPHEFPPEWHFGQHPRVPSITCQAEPPYIVATRRALAMPGRRTKRGGHGYDPALPEMQALFVAHGPAFTPGARIDRLHSVDVYALLCRLLGIEPAENQGDPQAFDALLRTPSA